MLLKTAGLDFPCQVSNSSSSVGGSFHQLESTGTWISLQSSIHLIFFFFHLSAMQENRNGWLQVTDQMMV